jgi:hypothetical protein
MWSDFQGEWWGNFQLLSTDIKEKPLIVIIKGLRRTHFIDNLFHLFADIKKVRIFAA